MRKVLELLRNNQLSAYWTRYAQYCKIGLLQQLNLLQGWEIYLNHRRRYCSINKDVCCELQHNIQQSS